MDNKKLTLFVGLVSYEGCFRNYKEFQKTLPAPQPVGSQPQQYCTEWQLRFFNLGWEIGGTLNARVPQASSWKTDTLPFVVENGSGLLFLLKTVQQTTWYPHPNIYIIRSKSIERYIENNQHSPINLSTLSLSTQHAQKKNQPSHDHLTILSEHKTFSTCC